jgi:DNA repair exonuclease SbcCD ATPase subunit
MIRLNEDRQQTEERINLLRVQCSTLESHLDAKVTEADRTSQELDSITCQLREATDKLSELRKEVKNKKQLLQYYEGKDKPGASSTETETNSIIEAIESVFSFLKGRRYSLRAKLLIEAIMSGKLFNGEAAVAVHNVTKCYIKQLFRPWKLVKAGDVSSVGCFKTSTINALREVVDTEKEGFFPLKLPLAVLVVC